jgi:NADPH2:quinone reductase
MAQVDEFVYTHRAGTPAPCQRSVITSRLAKSSTRRSRAQFSIVADGQLQVRIGARFPLAEARAAHDALKGCPTTGKVLLLP